MPVLTLAVALVTRYEQWDTYSWQSWMKVFGIIIAVCGGIYIAYAAAVAGQDAATAKGVLIGNAYLITNSELHSFSCVMYEDNCVLQSSV